MGMTRPITKPRAWSNYQRRFQSMLSDEQMRNLLAGVGCVQCGMPATASTDMGHDHCGRAVCKRELRVIEESIRTAEQFRKMR